MTHIPAACGGFLLAVLWMDLMFDVQAFRLTGASEDALVIASIATYYRRVTTDAFPMNQLIGVVMLVTLVTAVSRLVRSVRSANVVTVLLAAVPIGLALFRVFPNAVRLGSAADLPATQTALARSILFDHLACFAAIAVFTLLELLPRRSDPARRTRRSLL